ncbi:MAG: acetolactate synthase small subunit [Bacteroidales bacterium]|nr:acetolactate synthase small subunit [Bacteroidales bacterium]
MTKNQPMRQLFTVTVYSENSVGLLNRVSNIFTRRCLNIEDVSASVSSVPDIHKLTLTTWADRPTMEKVVAQLEKIVEVLKVFLYTDEEIVYQEIALYKVPTTELISSGELETLIRRHSARLLEVTPEYVVIEKTGHPWETEALFDCLRRYGIRQFVRSGRVCVTKSPVEHIDIFLEQQRERQQKLNENG